MANIVVAEIIFNRDAAPEELRRLGEILEECRRAEGWIARISGLDDLLRGECPQLFSKVVGNAATGELLSVSYDPILVWGRSDYPGKESINPQAILRAKIPTTLGSVTYPDPDGGV